MKYHYNLSSLFDDVCKEYGEKTALHYAEKSYSYHELNTSAEIFGNYLLLKGLKPGNVVAIVNTKEFESYAMMLGCLKTGIAYTNMDQDTPVERAKSILQTCRPDFLFCDQANDEKFKSIAHEMDIPFASLKSVLNSSKHTKFDRPEFSGDRIAYIMFTSGSTGTPKGVAVTHQNIFPFIKWTTERFQVTSADIFANVSPMYFDNSVFDFYTAFFSGASLAPIKKEVSNNPKELVELVKTLAPTIWFSVPSLLMYLMTVRALNKTNFRSFRTFVFGGEGYPKKELKKLFDELPEAKLVNVYGPTEGTCICSSYDITSKTFENIEGLPPLGKMNPNFDFMVIDENGNESTEGELLITGPNISLGYYRDPERTSQSFTQITTDKLYRVQTYKTGDLVKRDEEGVLYFIGRKDNQIKHMGYRIELEEIELALNLLPEIDQSAVIYHRERTTFGKIIAFVSTKAELSPDEIRGRLSDKLPSYMLPNTFTFMDVLPKNPNGKVDKHQLRKLVAES